MKICENCKEEHDGSYGSGRFCSIKCARGFSTKAKRKEINEKVSKKLLQPWKIRSKINIKLKPVKENQYCKNCNNILTGKQKSYCCIKCQKDFEYMQSIKLWQSGEKDGIIANGARPARYIIKYIWEKYEGKCAICGWNEINPRTGKSPLQIDHIDGNALNNDEENLILLCPNHHALTETYGYTGKKKIGRAQRRQYNKSS
jgi:hypothetical protein